MLRSRFLRLNVCAALLTLAAAAANIPRRSPEFAINTNSGKQILLTSYRGKVVALVFILTYCPHCQKTTQILSQLQKEYGPRGFQVLASAIEDGAAMAVPDFIKRFNPPFPVGFNERSSTLEYLQHPPMTRLLMPQLVFVDRQGTVRAQFSGEQPFFSDSEQEKNLRNEIESLLKEGAVPAARAKQKR